MNIVSKSRDKPERIITTKITTILKCVPCTLKDIICSVDESNEYECDECHQVKLAEKATAIGDEDLA